MQLWFDLFRPPSGREADLLEEVLASWFMLGRLGAYNAQNLQVHTLPALATCFMRCHRTLPLVHHLPVQCKHLWRAKVPNMCIHCLHCCFATAR